MALFDINLLTGHVRIRTRREVERLAASVQQAGTPAELKEANVVIVGGPDGSLTASKAKLPTDERYIIIQFLILGGLDGDQAGGNVGSTFDLTELWPDGLPTGVTYYLLMNKTDRDINVVFDAKPQSRPADMIVKAGGCREASLYVGKTRNVLTISDDLTVEDVPLRDDMLKIPKL